MNHIYEVTMVNENQQEAVLLISAKNKRLAMVHAHERALGGEVDWNDSDSDEIYKGCEIISVEDLGADKQ